MDEFWNVILEVGLLIWVAVLLSNSSDLAMTFPLRYSSDKKNQVAAQAYTICIGMTTDVVEAPGTPRPGKIVPATDRSNVNGTHVAKPVASRCWDPNTGMSSYITGVGGYMSGVNRGIYGFSGMSDGGLGTTYGGLGGHTE
ncbi:uncharacterized protein LOC113302908 isoform X1 [Papaver somniferum]|uniref:uncharacterized protein LOC113302908 isoform X1 n=1 Tax=Papaver somniferum TaxID=3469 RepID=UPI000E6FDD8D|nr:uncharacterized protein LOC113302908 isoform X1 [Papaver somniferum]